MTAPTSRYFRNPKSEIALSRMSDILSQSEVDSLLAALDLHGSSSGDYPPHAAQKPSRQHGLSAGQVQQLRDLQQKFVAELAAGLRDLLALEVEVMPGDVDRLTWGESASGVDGPTCLATLSDGTPGSAFVVELESPIALSIVDRLLGGQGGGGAALPRRPLTDIELRLLSRIAELAGAVLLGAADGIRESPPRVTQVERDPQRVRFVPPETLITQIGFEILLERAAGFLTIRCPATVLERVSGKSPAESGDDRVDEAHVRVDPAARLVVQLASTRLSPGDVANLEVGDVIVTDCDSARPVTVFLDGTPRFAGSAGVLGERKAVRLGVALGQEGPEAESPPGVPESESAAPD